MEDSTNFVSHTLLPLKEAFFSLYPARLRQLSVYCGGSAESSQPQAAVGPGGSLSAGARLCSDYTASSFLSHLPHPPVACLALSLLFRVPQ